MARHTNPELVEMLHAYRIVMDALKPLTDDQALTVLAEAKVAVVGDEEHEVPAPSIEPYLARSVECPECLAQPGESCVVMPRRRNSPVRYPHAARVKAADGKVRWTAKEQPPGGATALLDDGVVAAIVYRPWGQRLGEKIAKLLNENPDG